MPEIAVECRDIGKRFARGRARADEPRETFSDEIRQALAKSLRWGESRRAEHPFWALRGVDLDIRRGETVGIVGRNGSGKSTLLKILSRITEPTTGHAIVRGRVASLLEVGTGFHPELTGRENIFLNGALLGMTRAEVRRQLDAIVEFADVASFLDTPVKRYSSGMHMRLAFAVAAHLEAEILLIDEVLAVGDASFQAKCLGKMSRFACEGRTVLFVSHNANAVTALCQRAIWLDEHRVAMDGPAEAVLRRYLERTDHPTTRELLERLPADPLFKLIEVRLTQHGRPVEQAVDAAEPLQIRLGYEVKRTVLGLRVLFQLCDQLDNIIIESFHDENEGAIEAVRPGTYVSTAVVPPGLIAPIAYRLKIRAGIHNGRPVMPLDGVVLPLDGVRPYAGPPQYAGATFAGRVAPRVAWATEAAQ